MIKPKHIPFNLFLAVESITSFLLKRKFNKIEYKTCDIKDNCSYIIMLNHFSFLDTFIIIHLIRKILNDDKKALRKTFLLTLEAQLAKNTWLRYLGAFSINPSNSKSVHESLAYAASAINTPGNALVICPQGRIESIYVDYIDVKPGIQYIAKKVNSPCQLIWNSILIDYYEGTKPSLYYNMLDCGMANEFDLDSFTKKINQFHKEMINSHIRIPKQE